MGHTKGEWSTINGLIYRRPYKELYEYGGGAAGEVPIAFISSDKGFFVDEGEIEANAKLIAAAPDLLLVALELKDKLFLDSHCVNKYASELMDLDKAIKKATS